MKKRVLVLGKNYSTPLGVIRSLGKAGYSVDMLYISRKIDEAEILKACRFLDKLCVVNEENDDKVLHALQNEFKGQPHEYVLFPTDDYSASFIDRFEADLSDRYLMPRAVGDSVTRLMDKLVQGQLAKETGFRTAESWTVSLREKPVVLPEGCPFPCFIKPLVSAKGGKVGISKCENQAELEAELLSFQQRDSDRSVMIQEFLHIIREYTIGGVASDKQIYIPAVIRKEKIAQYNRGITLSGVLADNSELSACFESILGFLRKVRYVGMFDFEILETDNGFYFGELNLRCGGPSYSYYLAGVNLPDLAVKAICGESVDSFEKPAITLGKLFLNNKVAWEDYANLFISRGQLKKLFSDIPATLLSDPDDPQPEKVFDRIMIKKYHKQKMKNKMKACVPSGLLEKYHKIKRQRNR